MEHNKITSINMQIFNIFAVYDEFIYNKLYYILYTYSYIFLYLYDKDIYIFSSSLLLSCYNILLYYFVILLCMFMCKCIG